MPKTVECRSEAGATLAAITTVGSASSSMLGSPTDWVLNGSSTIAAIRNRLATIVG